MPHLPSHAFAGRRRGTMAALAIAALGTTRAAAPAAAAPPDPSAVCSFRYANPNLFAISAYANVFVRPAGPGAIRVRLDSNPLSIAGYTQRVTLTWANLDTGKSGSSASTPVRVSGLSSSITLPRAVTGRGKVTLVVGAANTGSINPRSNTNGDCSAEYVVS